MTTSSLSRYIDDVACQCLGLRAARAARVVARQYDQALRPLGVSIGQYSVLMAVGAGAGRSISKLADALGLERTTLTRNLRVMEREHLVVLSDEGPRRTRSVSLTAKGEAMIVKAYPVWRAVQDKLMDAMGKEKGENARALLDLVGNLDVAES
ncbi:MAG: MarR family winged helix-turn-helix transcriptional regulator [Pseudomonadota bacterium]